MTNCRVEAIGRDLAALNKVWDQLDTEQANARGARRVRLGACEEELRDRISMLKSEASMTVASTPAGALVQIMIVASYLEDLYDRLSNGGEASPEATIKRAMTRALYSAADVVCDEAGEDMESLGSNLLMCRDWSPFQLAKEAQAMS